MFLDAKDGLKEVGHFLTRYKGLYYATQEGIYVLIRFETVDFWITWKIMNIFGFRQRILI